MKNKSLLFAMILSLLAGPLMAAVPVPSGINPATSENWAIGDLYRFVFITAADPGATLSTIEEYNALVQGYADAAGMGEVDWYVIGSTTDVDARDNTMTNPEDPNDPNCPIFLVDAATLVAVDKADLWDGEVAHIINQTETGATKTSWPFTGTYTDGTLVSGHPSNAGGGLDGTGEVSQGQSDITTTWIWRVWTSDPAATSLPLYAMSEILSYGSLPSYIYPSYGAELVPDNVEFLWVNLQMDPEDPNYTEDIYVEVLLGTEPNKASASYDMTAITPLDPENGYKVTTVTKEILDDGIYWWQVNTDIGGPNSIEGPLYWFEVISDPAPTAVELGPDMITWSGKGVDLFADVNDIGASALTYVWSYDAPVGVDVSFDYSAGNDSPKVTATKVSYLAPNVANNSFEVPVLADGGIVDVTSVPSWTSAWSTPGSGIWNDHSSRGGAYNPLASEYDSIPDGENVGWVTIDVSSDHCVYQVLSLTVQPSTAYELQAKVGNPGEVPTAGYRIEIVNDILGVVLASSSGASPNGTTDPNWFDASTSYTSGADVVADPNVGQTLGIRLVAEPTSGDSLRINFDNVQFLAGGQADRLVSDPSMSTVTIYVDVNDEANPAPGTDPVTDSMTIDVYETACKAASDPDGLNRAKDNPTDLDDDCDTDFDDLEIMVLKWLASTGAPWPVAK